MTDFGKKHIKSLLKVCVLLFIWDGLPVFAGETASDAVRSDGVLAVVSIKDYRFIPQDVTVKVGQSVRWLNNEKRQYHSVWFEALGEPEPEYFFPDESYERTFNSVGTFSYRCGPHPEMTGTVTVVE